MKNPFEFVKYPGPKLFCDRVIETKQLIEAIDNNRNITLFSIRRLGKTGLLRHVFHHLEKRKDCTCIYIDIFSCQNQKDFVEQLSSAVLNAFEKSKKGFLDLALKFFSNYRPKISYDLMTNLPSIQLEITSGQDVKMSIEAIFSFIQSHSKKVIIAIDEFQQVEQFQDKGIEEQLRSKLQTIENLNFIFSGSQHSILLQMFSSPKKALFRTTQMFPLGKIDQKQYREFILHHFKQGLRKISITIVDEILDWTCLHTYYTQYFCNRLYSLKAKTIKDDHLNAIKTQILREHEHEYYNYRTLLTRAQWKLLVAFGKEGITTAPTSKKFISKHNLGAQSTIHQSLKYLLKKEFIYLSIDEEGTKSYQVYDVFLRRWLAVL